MRSISHALEARQEDFFERWVSQASAGGIQYPGIITEDILGDGAELWSQLVRIIGRPEYRLASKKRINPLGKRVGERRAMTGVALEAVLELFILFRHELWELISELDPAPSAQELLELRRRSDLYLDQFLASVAYAYTSTKEKAMVGLIEKLLS